MSEPIPESIPTSADPRSKRPTKKRALTPVSQQSSQIEALFKNPDREVAIPTSSTRGPRALAPPPEIVANVQGSSAGAGSGEFHVYKASRRREYERLRRIEDEVKQEEGDREFEERREQAKRADEEKTSKNRARREKAKARKDKKKLGERGGGDKSVDADMSEDTAAGGLKKLGPSTAATRANDARNEVTEVKNGTADGSEDVGITFHDED